MEPEMTSAPIDFEARFQRSQGWTPRNISQNTKVTREEHRRLEVAARLSGQSLGEWSREVLLREADGLNADPAFTELVAMRLLLNTILKRIACGELMTAEGFNNEIQRIRNDKQKVAKEVMQTYYDTENSNGK